MTLYSVSPREHTCNLMRMLMVNGAPLVLTFWDRLRPQRLLLSMEGGVDSQSHLDLFRLEFQFALVSGIITAGR